MDADLTIDKPKMLRENRLSSCTQWTTRVWKRSGTPDHKGVRMTINSTPITPTEITEIRGVVLKGKQTAPGDRCPAKWAICRKCSRKGHYAAACFSKTVAASAYGLEAEDPA